MLHNILIVDDEPNVISSLKRALFELPYEVFSANGGSEGLDLLRRNKIKLVVSDEKMPEMSGSEFLSRVKEEFPETIRIMLTGQASVDSAMNAVNRGEIFRFFIKPWDDLELKLAIRSAIDRYDLEAENRRLLQIVKRQAVDLKLLEKKYPSITKLQKDGRGNLILPDISKEEFDEIIVQCEREFI